MRSIARYAVVLQSLRSVHTPTFSHTPWQSHDVATRWLASLNFYKHNFNEYRT